MSLNWDATKVRDFDKLTDNERNTRESLIWATMAIGMGEITEENAQEFYSRLSLLEKVSGASRWFYDDDGEHVSVYFTPEDVKRFIGLTTNVFPKWTQAKFAKHILDLHERFNVQAADFS
jgi:hypothetical protein